MDLKEQFTQKLIILSSFTPPRVVSNMYHFFIINTAKDIWKNACNETVLVNHWLQKWEKLLYKSYYFWVNCSFKHCILPLAHVTWSVIIRDGFKHHPGSFLNKPISFQERNYTFKKNTHCFGPDYMRNVPPKLCSGQKKRQKSLQITTWSDTVSITHSETYSISQIKEWEIKVDKCFSLL